MTGAMSEKGWQILENGSMELGIGMTPKREQFSRLLELLNAGNQRLNLTALKSEQDIVLKHFVDSLSCLRGNYLDGSYRILDLGTGAGFPSLPLAIMLGRPSFVPLDATQKKIRFVNETAQTLGLSHVQSISGRAENIGRQTQHRESYDRVVVRAVAALPILIELALPLLKIGGVLLAQKGAISDEEVAAGKRAATELGGRIKAVDTFNLPILGDSRALLVVEKVRATPDKYPRREGIPNQQPLFWSAK